MLYASLACILHYSRLARPLRNRRTLSRIVKSCMARIQTIYAMIHTSLQILSRKGRVQFQRFRCVFFARHSAPTLRKSRARKNCQKIKSVTDWKRNVIKWLVRTKGIELISWSWMSEIQLSIKPMGSEIRSIIRALEVLRSSPSPSIFNHESKLLCQFDMWNLQCIFLGRLSPKPQK